MKLFNQDNILALKTLPDNSVDSVVTDGPYGITFMNRHWDYSVPSIEFWKEVYRVLKPGGHVLSFGGTRTYHRMAVNIEDAGFEIRDCITWLYAQGFPKSLNIGKAVDKMEGNEREVIGKGKAGLGKKGNTFESAGFSIDYIETKGTTPYEGLGTGLKPANEPICLARKPISEKTIAENVIKWGTGGINIDGCRIGSDHIRSVYGGYTNALVDGRNKNKRQDWIDNSKSGEFFYTKDNIGRFPSNLILDEEAADMLDEQSVIKKGSGKQRKSGFRSGATGGVFPAQFSNGRKDALDDYGDSGGASRFFYVAKVSKKERDMGLNGFEDKEITYTFSSFDENGKRIRKYKDEPITEFKPVFRKNSHPTVKPINLLIYLCRLITPKNGIVLDPFMGSGSTGIAARLEGFDFIGMELEEEYFKIAEARINSFEMYRKLIK